MPVDFNKRIIVVAGTQVEVNTADLVISDISNDMTQVASQMAWWASVMGEAERELIEVDAAYRAFRSRKVGGLPATLAEWRVKAAIDGDAEFRKHKADIARCEGNIATARGMFDAFAKKANVLQSKGANVRSEVETIGLHTPAAPRPARSARAGSGDVDSEPRPRREGPMAKHHKMSDD